LDEDNADFRKQMAKDFEQKFAVGCEFDDIDALRDCAVDFGEKYNCPMTTGTSKIKQQTITMICKHGGKYRAAKKGDSNNINGTIAMSDEEGSSASNRTKITSKLGCQCQIKASRSKGTGKVRIFFSNSKHSDHRISMDRRSYAVNRRLDAHHFEMAVKLLEKHKPIEVLEVKH
jgi:hypothetical protein